MEIKLLYDLPEGIIPEDGFVFSPPFFLGVSDGVSGLYMPDKGPVLFGGKSGGRMVSDVISKTFLTAASKEDSLEEFIIRANEEVRGIQESLGFYEESHTDLLAGATFAIAKLGNENGIEIIQCGDAFAVVETHEGKVLATRNQTFQHDTEARKIIAELMRKHGENRREMWRQFGPILSQMRLRNVNRKTEAGYGLLNGQSSFKDFCQRIVVPQDQVHLVLLFTDGLIYYPDSKNETLLAQKVLSLYWQGGLGAILEETRKKEAAEKEVSHVDHAEATAIAIEFD